MKGSKLVGFFFFGFVFRVRDSEDGKNRWPETLVSGRDVASVVVGNRGVLGNLFYLG